MGIVTENSLWYKGKSEVLREFKKNIGAILAAVASRNFSEMPGFAIEALTDTEIEIKFKLTEHNQKIMGDAIDRELKALGLENDIALKQATMAWELEKMQFFADLQAEFADLELLRSLRGEEIDGLMIDQEIREIGVLLAKTAIELQVEDVKRQKEEIELLALPKEGALAVAKLAAAERKLAVIPYILAALAAQRTAIDMEASVLLPAREQKATYDKAAADLTTTEIVPLMIEKAGTALTLTVKQAELIPGMIEKAAASMALAAAMTAQTENHRSIAVEKVAQAREKVLRLTEEVILMGKEITLDGQKVITERDRAALELQRAEARVAVAEALRLQLGLLDTAMTNESAAELTNINTEGANEVAVKKSHLEKIEASKYAAAASDWASQLSAVRRMGDDDYEHDIKMADNSKDAKITEKLFHLIG